MTSGLYRGLDQLAAGTVIGVGPVKGRVQRPGVEDQRHIRGSGRSSALRRAVSDLPGAPIPGLRGFGANRSTFSSIASRMPDGLATAEHEIRSMVNDAGDRVGYAWFVPEERPLGRVIFIYDIEVEPAHRRKGHARAALGEIEAYARDHGCVGVQLHVFGENSGARQLCQRAGYVEANVTMLKRVDGKPG